MILKYGGFGPAAGPSSTWEVVRNAYIQDPTEPKTTDSGGESMTYVPQQAVFNY